MKGLLWLSALATPLVAFGLVQMQWARDLNERLRPSVYKNSPVLNWLILTFALAMNLLLIFLFRKSGTATAFWKKFLFANLCTIAGIFFYILLFWIVFFVKMSNSHWSFG